MSPNAEEKHNYKLPYIQVLFLWFIGKGIGIITLLWFLLRFQLVALEGNVQCTFHYNLSNYKQGISDGKLSLDIIIPKLLAYK